MCSHRSGCQQRECSGRSLSAGHCPVFKQRCGHLRSSYCAGGTPGDHSHTQPVKLSAQLHHYKATLPLQAAATASGSTATALATAAAQAGLSPANIAQAAAQVGRMAPFRELGVAVCLVCPPQLAADHLDPDSSVPLLQASSQALASGNAQVSKSRQPHVMCIWVGTFHTS